MGRIVLVMALVACGDSPPRATSCSYNQPVCDIHQCPYAAATGGNCAPEGASCDYLESTVACIGGVWTCTSGNCCPCGSRPGQPCGVCHDLSPPLNGCKGLLKCYQGCNQSDGACTGACDAGATATAASLLKTLGDCIDQSCYNALDADSGQPYCTDATMNDPQCNACYARIFASGGACSAAQSACQADGP